jgi:hypothetical protein
MYTEQISAAKISGSKLIESRIALRRAALERMPFAAAISDERVDPKLRLRFAPRLAPLVFSSAEFAQSLASRTSGSPTVETLEGPGLHPQSFVRDLGLLGFELPQTWPSIIRELWWMAEIGPVRMLVPRLSARISTSASAKMRRVLVDSIASAGGVLAGLLQRAAFDYLQWYGVRLRFFSDPQFALPSDMSTAKPDGLQFESNESQILASVDAVFDAFELMLAELANAGDKP